MIILSTHKPGQKKSHPYQLIDASLDGIKGSPTKKETKKKEKTTTKMSVATSASPHPQQPVLFSDDDGLSSLPTIHVTITTGETTFGWSDFPLLAQNSLYDMEKLEESSSAKKRKSGSIEMMESLSLKAHATSQRKHSHKQARHVRFDSVHIREHSVTIGDHDWCSGTLPVSLDWPHAPSVRSIAIDDYENVRERQGRTPRGRLPKLEHWQRKQLLHRVGGISEEDLKFVEYMEQGKEPSKYVRLQRTKTVTLFPRTT
mmetsp:Transcript_13395/g.25191  ORF Transcript_13395/g.25191 Transcript_13395/m.25191 type:complete len:258 (-) Transcript_13395:60-833(-)